MSSKNLSLILSTVSTLALLTSIPILLLLYIDSGMTGGEDITNMGEVITAYSCPTIVILSQAVNVFLVRNKTLAVTLLTAGIAEFLFAYTVLH